MQRQVADELPDRLLALREDLAKAMAPHHAFDVIFGVWMTYGRVRASTLQPLAGDALTSTAEFVAHVLLDRDGPEPTRSPSTEEWRSGANPYQLGEMVAEIVSFLPVLFTTRQLGHDGDLDPWLELRSRLYMHRLAVRLFTYEKQETESLMGLFKTFDVDLARALGYTVEQALALARGAGELPMIGAGDRGAIARAEAEKLRQVVAARREGKTVKTDYPDEVIDRLVEGSSSEAEQWIVGLTARWAWHASVVTQPSRHRIWRTMSGFRSRLLRRSSTSFRWTLASARIVSGGRRTRSVRLVERWRSFEVGQSFTLATAATCLRSGQPSLWTPRSTDRRTQEDRKPGSVSRRIAPA